MFQPIIRGGFSIFYGYKYLWGLKSRKTEVTIVAYTDDIMIRSKSKKDNFNPDGKK